MKFKDSETKKVSELTSPNYKDAANNFTFTLEPMERIESFTLLQGDYATNGF